MIVVLASQLDAWLLRYLDPLDVLDGDSVQNVCSPTPEDLVPLYGPRAHGDCRWPSTYARRLSSTAASSRASSRSSARAAPAGWTSSAGRTWRHTILPALRELPHFCSTVRWSASTAVRRPRLHAAYSEGTLRGVPHARDQGHLGQGVFVPQLIGCEDRHTQLRVRPAGAAPTPPEELSRGETLAVAGRYAGEPYRIYDSDGSAYSPGVALQETIPTPEMAWRRFRLHPLGRHQHLTSACF